MDLTNKTPTELRKIILDPKAPLALREEALSILEEYNYFSGTLNGR